MAAPLLAALILAVAPAQSATVRVPVANVWAKAGGGQLPLDPHVWPTSAVTYSQRLALVGHMPTQVLFGEQVRVLGRRAGWTKIAVADQPSPLDQRGYPGWIRSWQLGTATTGVPAATVTVTVRSAMLSDGTEVSFATRLPLLRRNGALDIVATPAGPRTLPAAAVAKLPRTRADIVRSARQFLGLHYLWGGLSAWGFDCSGLTWAAYRAHGITIPRDADAQFAAGRPISIEDAQPGDLVFYGTSFVHHVALYLGRGQMLEAPNSASEVRIAPFRTGDFAGVRAFL